MIKKILKQNFRRNEAPRPFGRGIFSLPLRRERNPSEAENSSHSSMDLRPRFSAKGDKGITLTELLIVVTIIAILALLIFWALRTQIYKGYDARRKGDIAKIKVAVEEYEKDHDCYPLPPLVTCKPTGTGLMPYLDKIPCDPRSGDSYYYDKENSTCPKWYRIFADLENVKDTDCTQGLGPGGIYCYYSGSPNAPYPSQAPTNFYGCRSGVCVPIQWNYNRPGPECDPNYYAKSNCYGYCVDGFGQPANECQLWQ